MHKKGFVTSIVVILIVLVVSMVGYLAIGKYPANRYISTSKLTQVTSKSTPESQSDGCSIINGSSFQSTNKYEVGLGPNGPVMGNWRIIFKDNGFQWGHSDITESGTYTCNNNVLEAKLFSGSLKGYYDVNRNILVWDDIEYTESTNDWKSKTTKLLSLKYPTGWEESQDKVTGGYTLLKPINNNKVWVGVNDYTYVNQSDTPEQLAKQALGNETPVNKKQIIVDGHNAVYQERHYPDSIRIEVYVGEVKEMTEFTAQDGGTRLTNGTHSLFMEIRDLTQLEVSRATLNQILSTFKYSR